METFSALLAICAGNSPVTGEFHAQRPVAMSFDVFFDLRLNKWLSKQSWGCWFEMPSHQVWRHCNGWWHSAYNRLIFQMPEFIRQLSHNASFCDRNVHTCAHFWYKMVHCGIFVWCIVGFVRWAYSSHSGYPPCFERRYPHMSVYLVTCCIKIYIKWRFWENL